MSLEGGRYLGQAKRRKVEIEQIKEDTRGISIVALHETGHAVAYFMLCTLAGRNPAEAVEYIEIYNSDKYHKSYKFGYGNAQDTLTQLVYKGCISPGVFMRELKTGDGRDLFEPSTELVSLVQQTSNDVEPWAWMAIFGAIAGLVAETMVTRKQVETSEGFDGDMNDCGWIAKVSGWSVERLNEVANAMVQTVGSRFSEPAIWRGINELARRLTQASRLEGRQCWDIYSCAVEDYEKCQQ
jgi:hypothetical protein